MLGCNKGFPGKGSKRSVELRGKKEAEDGFEQTVACGCSQKSKVSYY